MSEINPQKINKAYFIGIKGVGVSALAQVFSGLGIEVEGSDRKEKFFTDAILERAGIEVNQGFAGSNISSKLDLCVVSSAYLDQEKPNPEVKKARSLNIPVFSYAKALGVLFNRAGLRLAVAGTHGKSTTTAMLGHLLAERLDQDSVCVVGTEVLDWQSNVRIPRSIQKTNLSEHGFLIEADEYKEAFLNYSPHLLVLTNIDFDHPDYFQDQESYLEAFVRLIENMEPASNLDFSAPVLVARREDSDIEKVLSRVNSSLRVFYFDFPKEELELSDSARVYQLNAAAALKAAQVLKIETNEARKALTEFKGTRRRMEKEKISVAGKEVLFIDDYAHHPKEVGATFDYVFNNYPKEQVQVVFQPHTFSRSKAFLGDFVKTLARAKNLVLVPTYGSAREGGGEIQTEDFYEKIKKTKNSPCVYSANSLQDASCYLKENLETGELILTLGAGDVWKIKEKLKEG